MTEQALPASTQSAEFLQRRVSLFARILIAFNVISAVMQLAYDVGSGHAERLLTGLYGYFGAGTVVLIGLWLAVRKKTRAPRVVYAVEAVAVLTNTWVSAVGGRYLNTALLPELARGVEPALLQGPLGVVFAVVVQHYVAVFMTLAFTQVMALRAAIVPSRALHTTLLTAAVGVVLFLVTGLGVVGVDADLALREVTSLGNRAIIVAVLSPWWAMTTAMCAIISKVIYSLHAEVREARQLGQYVLLEKLGEGGMGEVYRARHAMMRRPTAIKLLPPSRTGEAALARFEREVQLTARLTHPNTITIFDYGRTPDGVFYYAMELLDGADLERIVDRTGPMPPARVARVLSMAAGALAEAHDVGLIHRDIKPANIILCERGGQHDVVKVVDFGLVKEVQSKDTSVTQVGTITGTPLFMAPETIRSPESIDGRADLYALGAVGYFLLTGQNVFDGVSVMDVCAQHLTAPPVPPSQRADRPVPADLEALILGCLEKTPDRRVASARELVDRLAACRDVGQWTSEDARAWWAEHQAGLRGESTAPVASGSATTVAVDLSHGRPA